MFTCGTSCTIVFSHNLKYNTIVQFFLTIVLYCVVPIRALLFYAFRYAFLSELTLFSISEKAMAMHPALAWRVVYILFFIVNMESYSRVMETGRLETGKQVGVNLMLIVFYYVFFGEFISQFYVLLGLTALVLVTKTGTKHKKQKKHRKPSTFPIRKTVKNN